MTSTIHPSELLSAAKEHDEYLLALDEAKQWWSAEDKLTAVLSGLDGEAADPASLEQTERWERAEAMFDSQIIVGLRSYLVAEGRALPVPKPPPEPVVEAKPAVAKPQRPVAPTVGPATSPGPVEPASPAAAANPTADVKRPAPASTRPTTRDGNEGAAERSSTTTWRERRRKNRKADPERTPGKSDDKVAPAAGRTSSLGSVPPASSTFAGKIGASEPRNLKPPASAPKFDQPSQRPTKPPLQPPTRLAEPASRPTVKGSGAKSSPPKKSPPKKSPPKSSLRSPKPTTPIIVPTGPNVTLPSATGAAKAAANMQVATTQATSAATKEAERVAAAPARSNQHRSNQHRKGNFLIGAGAVLLFVSLLGALFLRTSGTADVASLDEQQEAAAADLAAGTDDIVTQSNEVAVASGSSQTAVASSVPSIVFSTCGPDRATGFVENPLDTATTVDVMIEFSDGNGQFNPLALKLEVSAADTATFDVPVSAVSSDASKLQCMAFVRQFVPAG